MPDQITRKLGEPAGLVAHLRLDGTLDPRVRRVEVTYIDGVPINTRVVDPAPEPDWADVREAARNAGWTRHHEPVGLRPVATDLWSYYPPGDRFPDVSGHGAARVHLSERGLSIELHGPGKDVRERADLINPTPAKVLTVARVLGLVGLGGEE